MGVTICEPAGGDERAFCPGRPNLLRAPGGGRRAVAGPQGKRVSPLRGGREGEERRMGCGDLRASRARRTPVLPAVGRTPFRGSRGWGKGGWWTPGKRGVRSGGGRGRSDGWVVATCEPAARRTLVLPAVGRTPFRGSRGGGRSVGGPRESAGSAQEGGRGRSDGWVVTICEGSRARRTRVVPGSATPVSSF